MIDEILLDFADFEIYKRNKNNAEFNEKVNKRTAKVVEKFTAMQINLMLDLVMDEIATEECEKRLEVKYPKLTEIFLRISIKAPEFLFEEAFKEVVEK